MPKDIFDAQALHHSSYTVRQDLWLFHSKLFSNNRIKYTRSQELIVLLLPLFSDHNGALRHGISQSILNSSCDETANRKEERYSKMSCLF